MIAKLRHVWLLVCLLTACAPAPAPPISTATPTRALPTFTPTPLVTLTHTPAPKVTQTLAPTLTPTIPTNTLVERGAVPPGFSLTVYAEVFQPTSLTFGPDGRLYVASTTQVVYALADTDGDRRADKRQTFAWGVTIPLGLLWVDDTLYISYRSNVQAVRDEDGDGVRDWKRDILTGLPGEGRHQNDGMALGADGYIYLGMGSTCDVCREADPRSASILRFEPDGSGLRVFARGLRNPYDLAFNTAGDLFATDNGRDDLGRDAPPEELNHIVQGGDYGWPDCYVGATEAKCARTTPPVATFTPRSSANGLVFYTGENFPPEYRDNAFVAVLGSYVYADLERGLQRVRLTQTGDPYSAQTEWFLRFQKEGRPLDVTVGPDGGLYVADYELSLIYRIVYGAP